MVLCSTMSRVNVKVTSPGHVSNYKMPAVQALHQCMGSRFAPPEVPSSCQALLRLRLCGLDWKSLKWIRCTCQLLACSADSALPPSPCMLSKTPKLVAAYVTTDCTVVGKIARGRDLAQRPAGNSADSHYGAPHRSDQITHFHMTVYHICNGRRFHLTHACGAQELSGATCTSLHTSVRNVDLSAYPSLGRRRSLSGVRFEGRGHGIRREALCTLPARLSSVLRALLR